VVITDGEGRVVRLLEKPTPGEVFSDRVNMGAYIVEPEVLAYLPPDQPGNKRPQGRSPRLWFPVTRTFQRDNFLLVAINRGALRPIAG
jgi:NDP-sugar pyrophosphorylase family protein